MIGLTVDFWDPTAAVAADSSSISNTTTSEKAPGWGSLDCTVGFSWGSFLAALPSAAVLASPGRRSDDLAVTAAWFPAGKLENT